VKTDNRTTLQGTLKSLYFVNSNIAQYKTQLAVQGLTEEAVKQFIAAEQSVTRLNREQYDLANSRAIVLANLNVMNNPPRRKSNIFTQAQTGIS
jgi:hypothetical protein